jgi:hypothetical protein
MTLNWQKTALISSIIVAIAIVTASFSPATSQGRGSSFMIASSGGSFVWRVNVSTGAVSYCVRRDDSTDEKFVAKRAPFCSAQSAAVQ